MTRKNTGEAPTSKVTPAQGGEGTDSSIGTQRAAAGSSERMTAANTAGAIPSSGGVKPSVGRAVHYFEREEVVEASRRERDPVPCPGIIRRVRNDKGECDLVVFTDLGSRNIDAVPPAIAYPQSGAWAWPPRV